MRWLFVFLVFTAGIAIGALLVRAPANESVEAEKGAGAPASPPAQTADESIDRLLLAQDFGQLAVDLGGDFERFAGAVSALPYPEQLRAVDAWIARHGADFPSLLRRAGLVPRSEAIDALIDVASQVTTAAQQETFEERLAALVRAESTRLTADNRLSELDRTLERITLALPELSDYFLRLGTLRVQEGDEDGALAVLAQIQNHAEFGPKARALLEDLSLGRQPVVAGIEKLPLTRRGDQYIVDARLDGGPVLSLLVDTGASMTVISRQRLESLGYVVDGLPAYFATAGGVVEGPVMTMSALALGGATVRQLPVGVLPIDFPGEIDGLLGMNFLRHFEFRIDQETATLSLDSTASTR